MTAYQLNSQHFNGSFSSHNAIGSAIIAAALLAHAIPEGDKLSRAKDLTISTAAANDSYQDVTIIQRSTNPALVTALQSLYEDLAANQQELDADANKILRSNLWDLYA